MGMIEILRDALLFLYGVAAGMALMYAIQTFSEFVEVRGEPAAEDDPPERDIG